MKVKWVVSVYSGKDLLTWSERAKEEWATKVEMMKMMNWHVWNENAMNVLVIANGLIFTNNETMYYQLFYHTASHF